MVRIYLSVFVVAAFLGGAVAAENSFCLVEILSEVTPERFYGDASLVCNDLKGTFERVRSQIKMCTSLRINTDRLETLHEDFCSADSDFRRELKKHEQCFMHYSDNRNTCYRKMKTIEEDFGSYRGEICSSVAEDTRDCLNNNVGKPCGDAGLKVYKRMTEAQEPFFSGICLETASGEGAKSALLWFTIVAVIIAVKWYQY